MYLITIISSFIGYLQRFLNKKINDIIVRITKMRSTDVDREFLYSRLIDILIINNRLNDVEAPYMVGRFKKYFK